MTTATTTRPTQCLKSDALWSGAASLATVSAIHGVPLDVLEIPKLSHLAGEGSNQEGNILIMGRALGYEAVAMEGGYEDLPDVLLPLLVALKEEEVDRYAVLFTVSDAEVTVGDPKTGEVSVWPRARFAAIWTGSVVQLTPVEEERRAVATRLAELRDRVRQALLTIGWGPPYRRKIAMLAAWGALVAVAAEAVARRTEPLGALWIWLLTAACVGSLWSWLASESCNSCSYAHRLAGGLPVAPVGVALYASLLLATFAPVPAVATAFVIGAAVGAHGALLTELAKAKIVCGACLFVAACGVGAAAVAIAGAGGTPIGALLVAAVITFAVGRALLPRAQGKQGRTWRATAERLARDAIAEPHAEGPTRLVAFTRKGCTACAFFHAAIKPALRATFGDAIMIDERELGRANTVAPILIVLGAPPVVFVGLPTGDSCARMLETMKEAVEGGGDRSRGMVVFEA